MDDSGRLISILETRDIEKTPQGAAVRTDSGLEALDGDRFVSMNMWMLTPTFLEELQTGFADFRASAKDPLHNEYLLISAHRWWARYYTMSCGSGVSREHDRYLDV